MPKFDLEKFNPGYFDRLRSRVIAARDRGIYVGVMLFQGWSIYNHDYGNPWPLHPFNQSNNINGINGDPDKGKPASPFHKAFPSQLTTLPSTEMSIAISKGIESCSRYARNRRSVESIFTTLKFSSVFVLAFSSILIRTAL
jgi:hypothetical protein